MSCRRNTPTLLDRGTVVAGRYRIDDCLAWGGMGVVYAATHVDLGHRFALKFLRPDLVNDVEACERFLDEARIAASFRGEHIARVLDYGHERGVPFMVVEYLDGDDLWTLLDERGTLSIEAAVDYVAEACAGLAEVHAAGIVHRDLKPENLFLARLPSGRACIKLLDFGVCKRIDSGRCLTKPKKGVGSPLYMSPEQMRAQPIDARADVWALGTVLYELVTGRLPFDAESVVEICNRVLKSAPRAPRLIRRGVPAELDRVILRCLDKDRDRRFRDVAELAAALVPFGSAAARAAAEEARRLLGKPGFSAKPAPERRAIAAARRGGWVVAAALVAAVCAHSLVSPGARAQAADEPLPPARPSALSIDAPALRFSTASALPEPQRERPVLHVAARSPEPVADSPRAQPVSLETPVEPPVAPACPVVPEPEQPDDALDEAPPAEPERETPTTVGTEPPFTPVLPARRTARGAWQI